MPKRAADPGLATGEVARRAGVSADTVRHYERLGLLPRAARTPGGNRRYLPETLRRMRVIQSALALGFTLRELGRILSQRDAGGTPCQRLRTLGQERLEELEAHLRKMLRRRRQLRSVLRDWDRRLAGTPPGERAFLLESLFDGTS